MSGTSRSDWWPKWLRGSKGRSNDRVAVDEAGKLLSVWILAAFIASTGAVSQEAPGSPRVGLQLSQSLCSNCHLVTGDQDGRALSDVPAFSTIANTPGASAEVLAGKVIVPHPEMPEISLTRNELQHIIAYILSLKNERAR